MVRWAGTSVPYYRERFREIGFDPNSDFDFTDYQRLPVLDKETIRTRAADLIAEGYSCERMVAYSTGGSTGVPVHFWVDEGSRAWRDVASEWACTRVGFRAGNRLGLIWGANLEPRLQETKKARLVNWLAHQQPNDCFRLSDDTLDRIDARLSAYQPDFLRCYTSALTLLARRLQERGKRPTYPRLGIITGAEKLDDTQREVIQDVFKAAVYESYGSRDCGVMAMQMSASQKPLHVAGANVLLEPLGNPDPTFGNEVAVTLLHGQGMPFLRYRIGDHARFPWHSAERPAESLEEVTGRMLDHIHLPGGRLIHSVHFPHLFKDFDLREYQVVQRESGDVEVLLVPGPHFRPSSQRTLERIMHDNLVGVSLSVSLVPAIERTLAGKLRPVVSYYRNQASPVG